MGLDDVRSGAFKTNGDRFQKGLEVAIEELNASGGLLGKKIELFVEDNQVKPDIAVQKLKKLILSDKCDAIFHGSSSAVGLAISQAMPRYKKIYCCMAAFAVDLTTKHFNPYIFRTDANFLILSKAMAMYVGKYTKLTKPYLIDQDYSSGHDAATYYWEFIKEVAPNTTIVGNDFHPMFNKDFAPYISKIKASGADYVLTGNWGTDLIQLVIQGRSLGMNLPVAGILQADINALAAMPGDQAVGNFAVSSFIPGLRQRKRQRSLRNTFLTSRAESGLLSRPGWLTNR